MNLNIKTMFLAMLLPFVWGLPGYGQADKGYQITGEISGAKDGTLVSLKSAEGKEITTSTKAGKFSFNGKVPSEGIPYTLGIPGKEQTIDLLLDNSLVIHFAAELESWPKYSFSSSKARGSYLDFQQRIQGPFSAALQQYQKVMKALTRKGNFMDWETAIKQSRGIDSLRMVLPREIYNTATQTYIKEVFLWLGMYPDSYYNPQLIGMWWPESDKLNAYHRLSQKVKNSYYGRVLHEQLKSKK